MGDDSEWLKLPTDEKVQHKLWKARLAGYEEVIKLFQTLADEKSPEFFKYLGLVKKFVVDGNAIAQEKGLEATLAFVENAAVAGKAAGEVCNGVVSKCLNQRAKTKDLGVAILMAFIEAEKQEIVQDELMKGLANKQPKIVAVCVVALREALRDFGTKIISIKPILKQLQALLEDRDKTVRDETKQLAVEIYRWIGPALKPQLSNLKPYQVTELESEFEKLPPGKPQQTRFLRSQQDLKAKMLERAAAGAEEAAAEDVDDGASAAPDVDPYDLIDPVDILSKLPKDFYEKVEEKKWQERREALEAVQKLAESPKLEQGDYSDLLRALRKVVAKDSNVMLVTMAAKCIALLATGLRKKFGPHSVGCIEVLIEKFREKKVSVVQALKEAIDACYVSTTLEAIGEVCVAALDHKTPSVKAETASFLARCFAKCTPATLPKKTLKLYIAPLLKAVNDSAGEVREAAFDALGTAMKVITEKALMPFLPDVDNLKMAKIKESCEKAVVVGKGGAPKAPAGEGPAKAPAQKAAAPPGKAAPGAKPPAKKTSVMEAALDDSKTKERVARCLGSWLSVDAIPQQHLIGSKILHLPFALLKAFELQTFRSQLSTISGIAIGRLSEERKAWRKDHPFLHVMEPKYPEDIYKSHLKPHRLLIGQGTVDSARQNLLALFPNGLVNAAVGKDKLLMDDGNTWLYKNKEHGPILLWDINGGLGQLHKYLYSKEDYIKAQEQGWPPERTSRFCAKEALQNPVSILTQTVAKQSVGQLRYGLQALPILSPGAAMSLTQNRCQPDFDDSNFNSNNNTWQCRRCQTMNGSTAARCSTCQDFRFPYGIVPPDSWSDNDYEDGLFMMSRIDPVFVMIKTILAGGFVPSIDGVSCGVISPQQPLPCKVIRVQAVQNLAQFQLYTVQKQLMMNQSPPIAVNEELLWHGTSHAGMLGIVRTNFNRSFAGTNGTRFGRGCYFSKSAVYSADDRFATPTQLKKYQTLILAKILLGNVVLGKKGMNQPPKNYHSAVDDVHQPTKFVIFRDTQMLPTYVVTILKK